MRQIERIPIVIDFFKSNDKAFRKFTRQTETLTEASWKEVKKEWLDNYDQRLGQLLINQGFIVDNFNIWDKEETDWLVENGYFKFEDIHFWGVNYTKDMKLLTKTKYVLLKDLEDNHIENIIKFFKDRNITISPNYLNYFNKRLEHANIKSS